MTEQEALKLKFTPLEFETTYATTYHIFGGKLKFTPLEFETMTTAKALEALEIKIYSVGV